MHYELLECKVTNNCSNINESVNIFHTLILDFEYL